MTKDHDGTPDGIDRRYKHAVKMLKPEVRLLCDEVGENVMVAALCSAMRDCAQNAGFSVCQYQMILIDELALTNRMRRAMIGDTSGDADE